jgi:CBS domain-containing protein
MKKTMNEIQSSVVGRDEEAYFDSGRKRRKHKFDRHLLSEPVAVLSTRSPIVLAESTTISDAMSAMQRQRRGCVLVTANGTPSSPLTGIFTERDVLQRVIDGGRNPAQVEIGGVMTRDPETLTCDAKVSWVLNMMSVGGFRHVPIVNPSGSPAAVVSVRDIVEFLVASFPEEILNLPPEFVQRQVLSREGA